MKKKRKKSLEDNIQVLCNNQKDVTSIMKIPEGEKKIEKNKYLMLSWLGIFQINYKHQTTDAGSTENTKLDKSQRSTPKPIQWQELKTKSNLQRSQRSCGGTFPTEGEG